jgi:hypothetical protein
MAPSGHTLVQIMAKSRRRFRNHYAPYTPDGYEVVVIDDYFKLKELMLVHRGHKCYSHDVFGPLIRFRSLVCIGCKTKFICTDKRVI